jgi:prepilin-type N-terminal cleavage/methylation domain-containing protein/prepilin-type processing-associated H-X9-DG protein
MLRRGVTLVEVLVTIGIIAMLIALLLPAVQSARESSRRLQCQMHVRELLVATHSHHDAKNAVPSLYVGSEPPYPITTEEQFQRFSWRVPLLPFLEQTQLWEQVRWDASATAAENDTVARTLVPGFICPSGGTPEKVKAISIFKTRAGDQPDGDRFSVMRHDYEVAAGIVIEMPDEPDPPNRVLYGVWGHPEFQDPTFLFSRIARYHQGRFSRITRGLSHTVAIVERGGMPDTWVGGENANEKHLPTLFLTPQCGWSASHSLFTLLNRYGVCINQMNEAGMYSFHPAGANIGMADGSVRFLADTTSFQAIMSLYGGSVEGLPERP